MITTKIIFALPVTALLLIGSHVNAGGSFSMVGKIETDDTTNVKPVDENHIMLELSNAGTITLSDNSSPMHGAKGGCSGSVLIAMGKPAGSGYCTYIDADGDTSIVSWSVNSLNEQGGNDGTWEVVGGTGKYAKAKGSGSYSSVPNADRTQSLNTIDGVLELM